MRESPLPDSAVVIANVRPALLGTYGDGGNAAVLRERLRRRGIDAEVVQLDGREVIPRRTDIVVFGGGEDDAQRIAASDEALGASLRGAIDAGAVVFAVCAGFQLLGHTFQVGPAGTEVAGFGVLDCRSDRMRHRAVGEVVAESSLAGTLTGFENHGGRTVLGPDASPLGDVSVGVGNGDGGGEGAVQGNVIATYLHGPALARNPELADAVLTRVVGDLAPLEAPLVDRLRQERLAYARNRQAR